MYCDMSSHSYTADYSLSIFIKCNDLLGNKKHQVQGKHDAKYLKQWIDIPATKAKYTMGKANPTLIHNLLSKALFSIGIILLPSTKSKVLSSFAEAPLKDPSVISAT